MGYRYDKQIDRGSAKYFRAVEITGSLRIDLNRKIHFNQILLMEEDRDTLEFTEKNLVKLVKNSLRIMQHETAMSAEDIADGIVPLLESMFMRPEKDILHRLAASMKKAILSMALLRYNSDKVMICNVLGLSGSQLDDEMRSCGFALIADKEMDDRLQRALSIP